MVKRERFSISKEHDSTAVSKVMTIFVRKLVDVIWLYAIRDLRHKLSAVMGRGGCVKRWERFVEWLKFHRSLR
jgi:hypothetical protein